MKITVDLPDDLLTELKSRAAREKRRLRELIVELLRAGLECRVKHSGAPRIGRAAVANWVEK